LSIIKAIRTGKKKGFSHAVFVELFMAHLLVKNSRFYHLLNLRYIQNQKCYNIMGACSKKNSQCFSNAFFTCKTALDVQPRDTASSGLSRYI